MEIVSKRQFAIELLEKSLESKIDTIQSEYNLYKESAANETKSTAGDKHDTSKSMMQLEQEKLGAQLQALKEQKKIFQRMKEIQTNPGLGFGSFVETEFEYFLIGISSTSSKMAYDKKPIHFVSMQTPIGKALQGLRIGSRATFNGKTYDILNLS
jgi:chromosomal replication initiation ATPase DnaA